MAMSEYEHVVKALGPYRSHPSLRNGIGFWCSDRCPDLMNT